MGVIISIILLIGSIGLLFDGILRDSLLELFLGGVCIIVFILVLIRITEVHTEKSEPIPQAIDVYRGKTTLQITYQDSIPVDSVVVFKEN